MQKYDFFVIDSAKYYIHVDCEIFLNIKLPQPKANRPSLGSSKIINVFPEANSSSDSIAA